jgi:hypothetical protein
MTESKLDRALEREVANFRARVIRISEELAHVDDRLDAIRAQMDTIKLELDRLAIERLEGRIDDE